MMPKLVPVLIFVRVNLSNCPVTEQAVLTPIEERIL